MTTAVSLLMRDITLPEPANGQNSAQSTPSQNSAGSTPVEPISFPMFPVMPVADVLITERRICRACGSVSEAQSDRVHRLLSSCAGDPFKRVLRPRKPDEPPLDLKVEHFITVYAEHCACCWSPTHLWGEVWNIQPEAPVRRPMTVVSQAFDAMNDKASSTQKLTAVAKMRKMTDEEAADYL